MPQSHNEVGLVRAIVVKVGINTQCAIINVAHWHPDQECSSSKRKEMWRTIQNKINNGSLLQLILYMKVQWSSTYLMLDHAERKKDVRYSWHDQFQIGIHNSFLQCIDAFIDELRWEEHDSAKRDKIHELKLTSDEWVQVNIFLGLLSVCLLLYT